MDNAINWINFYLVDNAIGFLNIPDICWIVIYPVDTAIQCLHSGDLLLKLLSIFSYTQFVNLSSCPSEVNILFKHLVILDTEHCLKQKYVDALFLVLLKKYLISDCIN